MRSSILFTGVFMPFSFAALTVNLYVASPVVDYTIHR
jgi:hypothetical protein